MPRGRALPPQHVVVVKPDDRPALRPPWYGQVTQWGTPMFGNVTALVGLHVTGKIQELKHAAHLIQACGLGSSQVMSTRPGILIPGAEGRSGEAQVPARAS